MLRLCLFIMSTTILAKTDAALSAPEGLPETKMGLLTSRTSDGAQLSAGEDFVVKPSAVSSTTPTRLPVKMHHASVFVFLMSAAIALAFLVKKCFGGINSKQNASSARRLAEGKRDEEEPCTSKQGEAQEGARPKEKKEKKKHQELSARVMDGIVWLVDEETKTIMQDIRGTEAPKALTMKMIDNTQYTNKYRTVGEEPPVSGHRRVKEGRRPTVINGVYFEADDTKQCLIKEIPGDRMPQDIVTRKIGGVEYTYKYKPVGDAKPVSGNARVGPAAKTKLIKAQVKGTTFYVDEANRMAYPKNWKKFGPERSGIRLGGVVYETNPVPNGSYLEGEGVLVEVQDEYVPKPTLTRVVKVVKGQEQEWFLDKERNRAYPRDPRCVHPKADEHGAALRGPLITAIKHEGVNYEIVHKMPVEAIIREEED